MADPAIKPYDWAWRQDGPMTFRKILMEAVEVCSPELYLRRLTAIITLEEMFAHGLLDDWPPKTSNMREQLRHLRRLADVEFVRAYLRERRAGQLPRAPGPPPEWIECQREALDSVQRVAERDREARESLRVRNGADVSTWTGDRLARAVVEDLELRSLLLAIVRRATKTSFDDRHLTALELWARRRCRR